jgi:ATP-binding cassette subfamily B protein
VEIQNKINRGIYEQAISTDYKYFDDPVFYNGFTFAVGELAAKSESALQLFTQILGIISVIIAMTAYLSTLGPWVIVISVVGQGICILAQRQMQKLGIKKTMESLPFDRKLQYVHRVAYQKQYAADMKSTDLPRKILSLFDKSVKGKIDVFKKLATPNWRWNMVQFTTWHLCQLAQLAYIIFCVFVRNFGIGTVTGMFAAAEKLNNMLNQFVGISGKAMEISLYTEKIRAFFDLQSNIEPQNTGVSPPAGAFSLDIRNVSFSYPNSDFALRNINISVKPGEKIAIVGENGAGKTTLAKLLLRLYDISGGDILYNGVSVGEYKIHELRRRIGVAFQETQLYALTVRENMTMYNSADDDTLRNTLSKTRLHIELDNEVTREFDKSGVMLSGGQAQKLGLTRLLHGEFGLLLLDEPSSALDPIAEYEMTKLIFEQSHTTTIIVAHRLSTIRDADRIYLINDGGVAEQVVS